MPRATKLRCTQAPLAKTSAPHFIVSHSTTPQRSAEHRITTPRHSTSPRCSTRRQTRTTTQRRTSHDITSLCDLSFTQANTTTTINTTIATQSSTLPAENMGSIHNILLTVSIQAMLKAPGKPHERRKAFLSKVCPKPRPCHIFGRHHLPPPSSARALSPLPS